MVGSLSTVSAQSENEMTLVTKGKYHSVSVTGINMSSVPFLSLRMLKVLVHGAI
jgi:hypothetical protein